MNARAKLVPLVLLLAALASAPIVRASQLRASAATLAAELAPRSVHELCGTSTYLPAVARPESEGPSIEDLRRSARSDGGRYVDLGRFPALRGRDIRTGP